MCVRGSVCVCVHVDRLIRNTVIWAEVDSVSVFIRIITLWFLIYGPMITLRSVIYFEVLLFQLSVISPWELF